MSPSALKLRLRWMAMESFEAMNAAAFLAYFGTVPQQRPPMGPAVGAGAVLVNYTKNKRKSEISKAHLRQSAQDATHPYAGRKPIFKNADDRVYLHNAKYRTWNTG